MSHTTPGKPLRTLCLTCSGSGDLDRQVARVSGGKIITGIVIDECWFCRGEGWITFGTRHQNLAVKPSVCVPLVTADM